MNKLATLRKALCFKQIYFSNILGIEQSAYSKIESGKNRLTDRNARILMNVLGINIDWFNNWGGDLEDPYLQSVIKRIHSNKSLQGQEDITIDSNPNHSIQNNVNISGNNNVGAVNGNNINIGLPEKGYQKIINSDGSQTTIEAQSFDIAHVKQVEAENIELRKKVDTLTQELINAKNELLDVYRSQSKG